VAAELARLGGILGGLGLAALLVAPGRLLRLAALGGWAVGGLLLALDLAPDGHTTLLAAAAVGALALAAVAGAILVRWPWLVAFATLACVPARIPETIGDEEANLL